MTCILTQKLIKYAFMSVINLHTDFIPYRILTTIDIIHQRVKTKISKKSNKNKLKLHLLTQSRKWLRRLCVTLRTYKKKTDNGIP